MGLPLDASNDNEAKTIPVFDRYVFQYKQGASWVDFSTLDPSGARFRENLNNWIIAIPSYDRECRIIRRTDELIYGKEKGAE